MVKDVVACLALAMHWSDGGQALIRKWSSNGHVPGSGLEMAMQWSSNRQLLVEQLSGSGQAENRQWSSNGQVLVRL